MGKSICGVTMEDLVKAGLAIEEAKEFQRVLNEAVSGAERSDPRKVWREVVARRLLKPWHPHRLHQLIYYSVYADWDTSTNGPPPYWFPSQYDFNLLFHFSPSVYPPLPTPHCFLAFLYLLVLTSEQFHFHCCFRFGPLILSHLSSS